MPIHPLLTAAINMKKHPDVDLTSKVRHHLCICLANFEDPKFLEGKADEYKEYTWDKYQTMCRLATDKAYFEENRNKVRLIDAPQEHVLFLVFFSVVLFECVISKDPHYKGPIKLEDKNCHGTIVQLLQAMRIISGGKFNDDSFNFENIPPDLRGDSPTPSDCDSTTSTVTQEKKPPLENFYKGKDRSPLEQLLDYAAYWIKNSPPMPEYYPHRPEDYYHRQAEEQVRANKALEESLMESQQQKKNSSDGPVVLNIDQLPPPSAFDQSTSLIGQKLADLSPISSSSQEPEDESTVVYRKQPVNTVELLAGCDDAADFVEILKRAKLNGLQVLDCDKPSDLKKLFKLDLAFSAREKEIVKEPVPWSVSVIEKKPIFYHDGLIVTIQYDQLKLSCPPKLVDTVETPLFAWPWLEKDWKLVRKTLKEFHDKTKFEIPPAAGSNFNEMFFTLHAIVDYRDHKYVDLIGHFLDLSTVALARNKNKSLTEIYETMRQNCIDYGREMRYRVFLSLKLHHWMNGMVDLTKILSPADFAAQGEVNVQWRYDLNIEAMALRKTKMEELLEKPDERFFLSFTWHNMMDLIGRHTKNVAATRLSKRKGCFMLNENESAHLGYMTVMLYDLWEKDVRRRHGLPHALRLTCRQIDSFLPKTVRDAIIENWNDHMKLFIALSYVKITPPIWLFKSFKTESDAPGSQGALIVHDQAEKRPIGDDGSLMYHQVLQVLDLVLNLHEFGNDDKNHPLPPFGLRPVDLKHHQSLVVNLVEILGQEAIEMVEQSKLLFENGHSYLNLANSVASKYGGFEVFSHCALKKENIVIGDPEAVVNGPTIRPVKYLCSVMNAQMAPIGLDLAIVLYNLVQTSHRPLIINQLISHYTHMISKSSFGRKDLDDIKVGKLVTFFGPFAAYNSLFDSYTDNLKEYSESKDESLRKKIEKLWLAKCQAVNDACTRYNNQKCNEEYSARMMKQGF